MGLYIIISVYKKDRHSTSFFSKTAFMLEYYYSLHDPQTQDKAQKDY